MFHPTIFEAQKISDSHSHLTHDYSFTGSSKLIFQIPFSDNSFADLI